MNKFLDSSLISKWKAEVVPQGSGEPLCGHYELQNHLEKLRTEFSEQPRLCFELAVLIVKIRRQINLDESLQNFRFLMETELGFFCEELNSRWLISIIDTLADYGEDAERIAAVSVSALINTVKLAETERLFTPSGYAGKDDAEKLQEKRPVHLWDGITSYRPVRGDMPRNLFKRMRQAMRSAPQSLQIFEALLERMKDSSNLFSRFACFNPHFWE